MKKAFVGLLFLLFFSLIPQVQAVDVDITKFDDNVGEILGIGATGGGLLVTIFFFMIIFGVLLIVTRKKLPFLAIMILGIFIMGFGIAATWLDTWFLLVICVIVAAMWAGNMRKWLSG